MEKRGGALMDDDRAALETRMKRYLDEDASFDDLKSEGHPLTRDAARYDARKARAKIMATEEFDSGRLQRYALRPYDQKWCYFTPIRPIWNEPRPSLWAQCWEGNRFLMTRPTGVANPEGIPFFFTGMLGDNDFLRGHAYYFPLRLKTGPFHRSRNKVSGNHALPGMDPEPEKITANLSPSARAYLASLGLPDPDTDQETAELIWYHGLAIGYSPAYLTKNADGIRQDWPRIPIPKAKEFLVASAALGRQVAALLDTEAPVPGVTAGKIRDDLKSIAVFQRVDGKPAKPESGDLDLTAGWGHGGKGGITMPGKGKLSRRDDGAYDIFLNEDACWGNVPEAVWDYTIGGYQVIKKWLSYREKPLLGRGLTPDEIRYITEIARRLATLIAMQTSLDDNYQKVVKATYSWPKK